MDDYEQQEEVASWHGIGELNPTKIRERDTTSIPRVGEPLDETNWIVWRERTRRVLRMCRVLKYVDGLIPKPDDPDEAENWEDNDNYAQVIIVTNISTTEMIHVSQCDTARAMWISLEAVHEAKGLETAIAIGRNLFCVIANDSTNIVEHLNTLKTYWEQMNMAADEEF